MAGAHVILKYLNQTKIKGGCQSGRKVVPHDSKSDLPLIYDQEKNDENYNIMSKAENDHTLVPRARA